MCSTAGVAQPKGTKRHYRTMLSITQCICAACEFNIIKYLFSISFNLLHFFSVVPHEVHETTAEYIFAFANRTQRMRLSDMYGVFSWIVLRLILRNMNKWELSDANQHIEISSEHQWRSHTAHAIMPLRWYMQWKWNDCCRSKSSAIHIGAQGEHSFWNKYSFWRTIRLNTNRTSSDICRSR